MTQTQERKTIQPAIMRSEELVDRIGHKIGSLAALSWQSTQQTALRVGGGLVPSRTGPTQPKVVQSKQPKQVGGMPQAEMQKAEGLVDDMGQRLGLLLSMVGLQARRTAAYAREGAEDIWVEAQHIRSARGH